MWELSHYTMLLTSWVPQLTHNSNWVHWLILFITLYPQKLMYGKETPQSMQRDTVSLETQVGHHCSRSFFQDAICGPVAPLIISPFTLISRLHLYTNDVCCSNCLNSSLPSALLLSMYFFSDFSSFLLSASIELILYLKHVRQYHRLSL